MRLHVADVTGDDRRLEQIGESEIAHLFVEARPAVAAVGDRPEAVAAVFQPLQRGQYIREELAAEKRPAEVPRFPQLLTLVWRQRQVVLGGDATT